MATAAAGARGKPPFRADHVGSFLRPKYLLDAREQFKTGAIDRGGAARASRTTRSAASCKFQEDLGLRGITDGEFRRTYFHIDFLTSFRASRRKGGIDGRASTARPATSTSRRP